MNAKRFRNICRSVAGSVGTGNVVGVALAISLGGPGAVFWMWVSALLGMAVKAREVRMGASYCGPMGYMPQKAARAYAALTVAASFGIGNALQAAAVTAALRPWGISALAPILLPALLFMIFEKGGTGRTLSVLTPFMAAFYILGAWYVIFSRADGISDAFAAIFSGAWKPEAVIVGISRGMMSHEAGLGSAALAHSDGEGRGADGALEVAIDTLLVSTTTALMLLVTGKGSAVEAAATAIPFAGIFVSASLFLFSFSSMLSWESYGEKCAECLGLNKKHYAAAFTALSALFTLAEAGTAAVICDLLNAAMAAPNLWYLYFNKKGR